MPTVDERLCHINLKVERAKEHISDLDREIKAFFGTNPYRIACKVDSKLGKPVYTVESAKPSPKVLPLLAGDAVHNLRTALDHLAYQLVCSNTWDNPPNPRHTYFPIFEAPVNKAQVEGKIQGAGQDSVDAIFALNPYKGGNDPLWILNSLNNIEKHRLLLTVGSFQGGADFAPVMADSIDETQGPLSGKMKEMMRGMSLWISPGNPEPLEPGVILHYGTPGTECDPNQKFRFQVAINEPGVIKCQPVRKALHEMTALVEGIIGALTPCLKDTP